MPLTFGPKETLRGFIQNAIEQVKRRQRDGNEKDLMVRFMRYMIGAKLQIVLGPHKIQHQYANHADKPSLDSGDFEIGDTVIHVTGSPTEQLIERCRLNLDSSKRPIIVTLANSAQAAAVLAENARRAHRIEIIEFESMIVTNLLERTLAGENGRENLAHELINTYSRIIEKYDPAFAARIVLRTL